MLSWRDLEPNRVSRQSLDSLLNFLSGYEKQYKKGFISMRLIDLAENTELAVATLNKALSDLEENGIIEIIPNKGNNQPKTYIFKEDLSEYEPMLSNDVSDLASMSKQLTELRQKLRDYEDFLNRIEDVNYEGEYAYVKVRKAPDGGIGIPVKIKKSRKTFNPNDYE